MRILVTGGTGFFGQATLRALTRANLTGGLHAVARTPPTGNTDVTWHAVDLLDTASARHLIQIVRPTHLVHFAWNAQPGKFWTAQDNLDWVGSTLAIYREFAAAGGQRFVGAGTCAEYDWSYSELVEDETPLAPATLYGRTKASTYEILKAACDRDGTSFAWGRIHFVYGPREQRGRLVSDVVCDLLTGISPKCSEGTQQRDFMHIEDYGEAFAALAMSDVQGSVNIASGKCLPVRQLVETIADQIGWSNSPQFGSRPNPPNDPHRLAPSVQRLKLEVGFTPKFSLETGTADTIAWWRSQLSC